MIDRGGRLGGSLAAVRMRCGVDGVGGPKLRIMPATKAKADHGDEDDGTGETEAAPEQQTDGPLLDLTDRRGQADDQGREGARLRHL